MIQLLLAYGTKELHVYLRVAVNGNRHKQYCHITLKGCLNRVVKCFGSVGLFFEKCLNEGCLLSNWIYIRIHL